MLKQLSIFFLLIFLYACGMPMGDRVDAENLQVYYIDGVKKSEAVAFAKYWKNNGFVGSRKQVVQLSKEEELYVIKLIERQMYHQQKLTIDERSKLQELERTLEKLIFDGNQAEIVITDNTFRPIERK